MHIFTSANHNKCQIHTRSGSAKNTRAFFGIVFLIAFVFATLQTFVSAEKKWVQFLFYFVTALFEAYFPDWAIFFYNRTTARRRVSNQPADATNLEEAANVSNQPLDGDVNESDSEGEGGGSTSSLLPGVLPEIE
jgi:hypothetical protein